MRWNERERKCNERDEEIESEKRENEREKIYEKIRREKKCYKRWVDKELMRGMKRYKAKR